MPRTMQVITEMQIVCPRTLPKAVYTSKVIKERITKKKRKNTTPIIHPVSSPRGIDHNIIMKIFNHLVGVTTA